MAQSFLLLSSSTAFRGMREEGYRPLHLVRTYTINW